MHGPRGRAHSRAGHVSEPVAEGIHDSGRPVGVLERHDADLGEPVDFNGLADAVPVGVHPGAKRVEKRVGGIDLAIPVPPELPLVELGESSVSDFRAIAGKETGRVSEELRAIVDDAVAITVQAKEGVVVAGPRPGDAVETSVGVDVEVDREVWAGKMKTVPLQVEEDRAVLVGDVGLGSLYRRNALGRGEQEDMKIVSVRMRSQARLVTTVELTFHVSSAAIGVAVVKYDGSMESQDRAFVDDIVPEDDGLVDSPASAIVENAPCKGAHDRLPKDDARAQSQLRVDEVATLGLEAPGAGEEQQASQGSPAKGNRSPSHRQPLS